MVDLPLTGLMLAVMLAAAFGVVSWWAILLFPWRPASTEEQIEPTAEIRLDQSLLNITVLIPARNEAQFIQCTLDAVKAQGDLSIIVIDDQSVDDTAKVLWVIIFFLLPVLSWIAYWFVIRKS